MTTKSTPAAGRKKGAAGSRRRKTASPARDLEALSEAIESGAGLPSVARAAAGALDASLALIDRSSAVLAVAASSTAEEEKLLVLGPGVERVELRVADSVIGELRFRSRASQPAASATVRMVATLIALEVERDRAPDRASDEAGNDFVAEVLGRRLVDSGEIAARAGELGTDLSGGGGVVFLRAHPHAAQTGAWRERLLMLTLRAVRAAGSGALANASQVETGEAGEVAVILPTTGADPIARAAEETQKELEATMAGFDLTVGYSRHVTEAADLHRAGKEALLAVNVGEADGITPLAFEETGSYRLLLSTMSEDPGELERFYEETVAPLSTYDEQYETDLVSTVEAYLSNDGNVTPTAETLFTHRHTVRYRLERVKELCGHDLSSTEGRERLGLGLKAMRVLGIATPRGPAAESRLRSKRAADGGN